MRRSRERWAGKASAEKPPRRRSRVRHKHPPTGTILVAEGTCQLATHFGVLSHGDYEMRVAVWRSLSHHGGSRYRVRDNLADDSLSHQPTG